jgi:hypothetical protein
MGLKTEFRRCSGCKVFRYCSKVCQGVDWREGGHRSTCGVHREQYKGWFSFRVLGTEFTRTADLEERVMSRERTFLRFLIHHDYLETENKILVPPMFPGDDDNRAIAVIFRLKYMALAM